MKTSIFFILLTFPFLSFAKNLYRESVLGEIQQTFIRDIGVSETFWQMEDNSIETKKKQSKVISEKTQKIKRKVVRKNVIKKEDNSVNKNKKPLVDNNDESDGWTTYKKREKRGLIDDGDFVKYEPPIKKEKSVLKNNTKKKIKKGIKGDWMSQKMTEQSLWNKTKKSDLKKWEKEKKDMLNKWEQDGKKYLKRLPSYKKNLVDETVFSSAGSFKPNNKKLTATFKGRGVVVVPNAFSEEVKDQGRRPTCSAFASTRGLEISLAQNGLTKRLSDQYLYYASKPYCQKSPCSKKGSWPLTAFQNSVNSSEPDIPLQEDCPYSKSPKSGNETQIPLKSGCFRGKHRLQSFKQVKSLQDIISALDSGFPVVSGFKLTPSFYQNKGVVLYKDNRRSKMDSHSVGHAILLVGYMKIPSSLGEGEICFLTANSWGLGWGKGGHACLSEKWVRNYRFNVPFLAIRKVI